MPTKAGARRELLSYYGWCAQRPARDGTFPAQNPPHEIGPPVCLSIARLVTIQLRPSTIVNGLAALDCLGARYPLPFERAAPDMSVQNFIGPVVVVEVRG